MAPPLLGEVTALFVSWQWLARQRDPAGQPVSVVQGSPAQ